MFFVRAQKLFVRAQKLNCRRKGSFGFIPFLCIQLYIALRARMASTVTLTSCVTDTQTDRPDGRKPISSID